MTGADAALTGDGGTVDVVVVGAGIAGLTAAYELTARGLTVQVLEAADEPGGCVRRREIAGVAVDVGAESFATAPGTVQRLIDDLGLTDRLTAPRPAAAWVHFAGGEAPLPGRSWWGVPSRPWAADVRRVLGRRGTLRAMADLVLPRWVGRGARTFGELVTARMGRRVVDRLVEPLIGGVYSLSPSVLPLSRIPQPAREALAQNRSLLVAARALSAAQPPGSRVGGLAGGMSGLIDELVRAIQSGGGQLLTGQPVTALDIVGTQWVVRTPGGHWRSAAVVLAGTADATHHLLGTVDPATDGGPVLVCTLIVDAPVLDAAPRGSGVLAAGDPAVQAKALTHATAKWDWLAADLPSGCHVLRLSYGRSGGAAPPGEDEFPQLALHDAGLLLGTEFAEHQLLGWALTPWLTSGPPVAQVPAPAECVFITGAWVAGTGLAAVIGHARGGAERLASALAAGPVPSRPAAPQGEEG